MVVKVGTRPARNVCEECVMLDSYPAEPRARATFDARSVAIVILAAVALVLLLKDAREVFIPLVLSTLLFYALDPVVDRLQVLRVPRALGAAVVLLTVVGAGGWTVYSVRDEAIAVVEDLPQAARNLRTALRTNRGAPDSTIDKIQRAATEIDRTRAEAMPPPSTPRGVLRVQVEQPALRVTEVLWWGSVGIVSVVSESLMVLLLAYFLLLADDLFKRKLVTNFGDTLSRRRITVQILDRISAQIARFLLVQLTTSVLVAVATAAALWGLGVRQAAFWGVASGVLNSIPYFGPLVVTSGLAAIAFMQFGTLSMTLIVAGTALLITTLEGWLLTPGLMGRAARMNQVAVFAGLIFWSWLWGFWGVVLAVPMMMVVKAVCDHIDDLKPIGDFLGA
jgi:predicted PurR-regulated permease PerM